MIWRPVIAGIATLTEIKTTWTLCDLYDAHEALDLQSEADAYYQKEMQKMEKRS